MPSDTPFGSGSGSGSGAGPGGGSGGGSGGVNPPSGPLSGGTGGTGGDEGETLPVSPGSSAFSRAPSSGSPVTPTPGSRTPGGSLRLGSDKAPERVGNYKITKELGRGGMGQVYLAVRDDGTFSQRVAIKIVKRGMETDEITRRFELERRVLAALNHPNIARIFDGGITEDGRAYFIMEYVEGMPLDKHCDSRRLTTEQRLDMFRQVCAAVHYAHQNLIVHRDIKPSNIIVTNDGVPKLMDFGIAKLLNPGLIAEAITSEGLRLMTPEYASPEQVRGEAISTASDIYSLGVLLYELLTGHRPYRIKSRLQAEIERIICEEEPSQPSTAIERTEQVPTAAGTQTITPESVSQTRDGKPDRLRKKLAGDVDNIVLMAMRKEPRRRYPSAEALSEDITRHLKGLPVVARGDSAGYRLAKFVRRHRYGVGAAALIALSLIGGVIGTSWQASVAAKERGVAQKERDAAEDQRRLASAQRDLAEQRFRELQSLARDVMGPIHDQIAPLAGSTKARETLLRTSEKYLDGLRKTAGDDFDLQHDLAAAYARIADIQGGLRGSNFGDTAGALKNYSVAIDMFAALRAKKPDNVQVGVNLAAARLRMQDLLSRGGDLDGADKQIAEAMDVVEGLGRVAPTDDRVRRIQANVLLEAGDAAKARRDYAKAADLFGRSLAIRRARAAERSDDATIKRDLSVGLVRLGDVQQAMGDIASAIKTREETLALRRLLANADKDQARGKRDVMNALVWYAASLRENCEQDKAVDQLRQAQALAEYLLGEDPVNARARRDLADVRGELGETLLLAGQPRDAADAFRARAEVADAIVKADTAMAAATGGSGGNAGRESRFVLAVSHRQTAEALMALGQTTDATRLVADALVLFEAISPGGGAEASDMDVREEFARALTLQSELSVAAGKAGPAASDARRAVGFTAEKDWRSLRALGRALAKSGDAAGARTAYDKAIEAAKSKRFCGVDQKAPESLKAERAALGS